MLSSFQKLLKLKHFSLMNRRKIIYANKDRTQQYFLRFNDEMEEDIG